MVERVRGRLAVAGLVMLALRNEIGVLLGLSLIAVGAWQLHPAAGLVVGGAALVLVHLEVGLGTSEPDDEEGGE